MSSLPLILALGLAVVGCGGDQPGARADLALPGEGDMLATLCTDSRADPWALPLTKTSANGLFKVTLAAGNPDPPSIGLETWSLDVTDATGTPLSGVTFLGDCHKRMQPVCLWMPDHGHGASVEPSVTAGLAAGSYTVGQLDLFMAGLWQVTFTLTPSGSSTSDTVVFSYCLTDPPM